VNLKIRNPIDIAVTGKYWVGRGAGSITTALKQLLLQAEDEVQITSYSLGRNTLDLIDTLDRLSARGIRVQLIVNKFNNQPPEAKTRLKEISRRYPYFTLLNFEPKNKSEELHAKIIVVDRRYAMIGSPNISWHGMIANHEIAIIVENGVSAKIASMIDKLARSPVIRRVGV
jgi:cardiolipin synthase